MTRPVQFTASAQSDIDQIFDWIAERAGTSVARSYLRRVVAYCRSFADFPERGTRRDDLAPGLRTIGFERRMTVAFTVTDESVIILRVLYAGRSVERAFAPDKT